MTTLECARPRHGAPSRWLIAWLRLARAFSSVMSRQIEKAFEAFDTTSATATRTGGLARERSRPSLHAAAFYLSWPPVRSVLHRSSGVLLVAEIRSLLQRMVSGPFDEERLDEVCTTTTQTCTTTQPDELALGATPRARRCMPSAL